MIETFSTAPSFTPQAYFDLVTEQVASLSACEPETLNLADALNRYLAEDILAPENQPSFANSQMDGYALTATACERQNRVFRVGADIAAGFSAEHFELDDNVAYPIMTGAAVPSGLRAVVPEEKCQPLGEKEGNFAAAESRVRIPETTPGQFVRLPGEDICRGEKLAQSGKKITPVLLGALSAQGITQVNVETQLRVLVVTGGDEISQDQTPSAATIRDANGPMLQALLAEDGIATARISISDSPGELIARLEEGMNTFSPHLIVSSGGISHGKFEVVKNAIAELEREHRILEVKKSWFGHVSQQPGGPQGIITLQNRDSGQDLLWLAFPGNPVSTLISYRIFLKPQLNRSLVWSEKHWGELVSAETLRGLEAKTQFRRAVVSVQKEEDGSSKYLITPDAQTGSHLLHRAAGANALVEIAPATTYANGDILRWYPLTSFDRI